MSIYNNVTIIRQCRNSRLVYTTYRSSVIGKLITNYF